MGSRAEPGPRGRLSIPSGAVGPRRTLAEAGAAPSERADSHPLAAALRRKQPRSAPAVKRTAAENQAGGGAGRARPQPEGRSCAATGRPARGGVGPTRLASPPTPQPSRPSRECKPTRPPAAAPTHAAGRPLTAAGRHLGRARAGGQARAPEPDVSRPRRARAPETPSCAVPAPARRGVTYDVSLSSGGAGFKAGAATRRLSGCGWP